MGATIKNGRAPKDRHHRAPADTDDSPPPPPPSQKKYHKNIGFLSNSGPDPLKITSIILAFNDGPAASAHQRNVIQMAFRWRAHDGPLIVASRSYLSSSLKNKQMKKPL